jgi:hypothetical protein
LAKAELDCGIPNKTVKTILTTAEANKAQSIVFTLASQYVELADRASSCIRAHPKGCSVQGARVGVAFVLWIELWTGCRAAFQSLAQDHAKQRHAGAIGLSIRADDLPDIPVCAFDCRARIGYRCQFRPGTRWGPLGRL